jgi:hypothetical protein
MMPGAVCHSMFAARDRVHLAPAPHSPFPLRSYTQKKRNGEREGEMEGEGYNS